MESKSLFKKFFDPPSRDINYRFSARRLHCVLQVFRVIEDHLHNDPKLASHPVEVSETEVESMKADFNKIACLTEKAHEAMKQVAIAFRARNSGIAASSSADELELGWGIREAMVVVFKAVIGAVLLGAYLFSNSLLAAVSTIITGIVFGGLAVGVSIVVWEYHKTDEEVDSAKENEGPPATPVDDHECRWNTRDACTTSLNVIGGSILVGTLMYPSATLVILSAFCTLVFFGSLAAIAAIILWEFHLGDNTSKDISEETIDILKNENNAEEISLRSWFQCTHEVAKALEDLIESVAYAYYLVTKFRFLSKELEDLEAELWLKKYLHNTNSICTLVQQKYGVQLSTVIVTYLLVVLIFHDRNRFVLESIMKTRLFISNSAKTSEMEFSSKPCSATSSIYFDVNEYWNETYREIWKNFESLYKVGFETETYKFERLLGGNPQFEANKTYQMRQLKEVRSCKLQAANGVHERNTKELDDCIFEKQQEQSGSAGLEDKRMNSDRVEKYMRREILECLKAEEYKKIRQNNKIDTTYEKSVSELNGQVIVKLENNKQNEVKQNALVKDSKDLERLTIVKERRHCKLFKRRNRLAYNTLIGRNCETEMKEKIESKNRDCILEEESNKLKIDSENNYINVSKNDSTLKIKRGIQRNITNALYPIKHVAKGSRNRFVNLSIFPPFENELSNLRRSSFQKLDQERQNADEMDDCEEAEEIPTLQELEERVEWLLDDGTKVNQWLATLKNASKNFFLIKTPIIRQFSYT